MLISSSIPCPPAAGMTVSLLFAITKSEPEGLCFISEAIAFDSGIGALGFPSYLIRPLVSASVRMVGVGPGLNPIPKPRINSVKKLYPNLIPNATGFAASRITLKACFSLAAKVVPNLFQSIVPPEETEAINLSHSLCKVSANL